MSCQIATAPCPARLIDGDLVCDVVGAAAARRARCASFRIERTIAGRRQLPAVSRGERRHSGTNPSTSADRMRTKDRSSERRRATHGRAAGHVSATAPAARARAAQPSGDARKGPRHLADVDVGARLPTRCGRWRAGSPPMVSSAACTSRSSATTGPRLYWSMIAAQALGGVPVPMYQDAPAAEFVYVLNDAEIDYALVEDQEQVDKLLEAAPQVPTLAHIYYDDPRGLRNYERRRRASRRCRRRAANSIARTPAGTTRRSRRDAPTTSPACSTRRARPASRRACGRRTPRSSRPRKAAPSSTGSIRTTPCSRTCRWRGSATTCSRSRNGSTSGSRSTAPNRARR